MLNHLLCLGIMRVLAFKKAMQTSRAQVKTNFLTHASLKNLMLSDQVAVKNPWFLVLTSHLWPESFSRQSILLPVLHLTLPLLHALKNVRNFSIIQFQKLDNLYPQISMNAYVIFHIPIRLLECGHSLLWLRSQKKYGSMQMQIFTQFEIRLDLSSALDTGCKTLINSLKSFVEICDVALD